MYLKEIRKNAKISQVDMCKKLNICRDTIRKLENGEIGLNADWIPAMSKAYKVDKFEILYKYLEEKGAL